MSKDYTATQLDNIKIGIHLRPPILSNDLYYPIHLSLTGEVRNCIMKFPYRYTSEFVGTGKSTIYTKAEVYSMLSNYSNLNTYLANKVKAFCIDAINEDPST